MKETNKIKREIQLRAHDIWTTTGRKGTLSMGTGLITNIMYLFVNTLNSSSYAL